jgi:hypothetical protein
LTSFRCSLLFYAVGRNTISSSSSKNRTLKTKNSL